MMHQLLPRGKAVQDPSFASEPVDSAIRPDCTMKHVVIAFNPKHVSKGVLCRSRDHRGAAARRNLRRKCWERNQEDRRAPCIVDAEWRNFRPDASDAQGRYHAKAWSCGTAQLGMATRRRI